MIDNNQQQNQNDQQNTSWLSWDTPANQDQQQNHQIQNEEIPPTTNASSWENDNNWGDSDITNTSQKPTDSYMTGRDVLTPEDSQEGVINNYGKNVSFIGALPKLQIYANIFQLKYNNEKALSEININNLPKIENPGLGFDGRYEIQPPPSPNTEFFNIVEAIRSTCQEQQMDIYKHWLVNNKPGESVNNIVRKHNRSSWIYILQGDRSNGEIILDFTSYGGPAINTIQPSSGILLMIPGWVPYSITRNEGNSNFVAICGVAH